MGTGTENHHRDRVVDLARGASIMAVVLGHWLVTHVEWADGEMTVSSPLEVAPRMWPLTWLLQVMPVFFFVGGFANRLSWESRRRRGRGYATFVDRRLHRLLLPTLVLVATLVAVAVILWPVDGGGLGGAAAVLLQPVWFLGIYVAVVALAPLTVRWHERAGWTAPAMLLAVVAAIDLLRFTTGPAWIGYLNVLVVWVLIHQVGYFWHEDRLGGRTGSALVVGGFAALVGLTTLGPYPLAMVGVPGEEISNMNPPNLTIVALAAAQVGILTKVARPLRAWLERPLVWKGVVSVNLSIMTVFLWHQASLLTVSRLVLPLGVPQPEPPTVAWWVSRLGWMLGAALLLAVIVALVGRFERRPAPSPVEDSPITRRAGMAAVALTATGLLVLAGTTVTRFLQAQPAIGIEIVPALGPVHLLAAGAVVMGLHHPERLRAALVGASAAMAVLAAVLLWSGLTPAGAIELALAAGVGAVAALTSSSSSAQSRAGAGRR